MVSIHLVLVVCFAALVFLVLAEAARSRRFGRAAAELAVLAAAALLLRLWIGFPRFGASTIQSFGAAESPWLMIGLVFACIAAGMAARYVFYLKGAFSWLGLLKPLCVSPIVLLPLLGTLQATSELEAIQVVSFCVLAFQNGFFWRVVFEQAQAKLKG